MLYRYEIIYVNNDDPETELEGIYALKTGIISWAKEAFVEELKSKFNMDVTVLSIKGIED